MCPLSVTIKHILPTFTLYVCTYDTVVHQLSSPDWCYSVTMIRRITLLHELSMRYTIPSGHTLTLPHLRGLAESDQTPSPWHYSQSIIDNYILNDDFRGFYQCTRSGGPRRLGKTKYDILQGRVGRGCRGIPCRDHLSSRRSGCRDRLHPRQLYLNHLHSYTEELKYRGL